MIASTILSSTSHRKFSQARQQAFVRSILHFFKRQADQLLPFDEVRKTLSLNHARHIGLQDVELNKIVGSVGRYHDFTREFLPLRNSQETRWRRIYDLAHSHEGYPSVELYKVGEAYFVRDGNHRVSVARANGNIVIEAYVTEYLTMAHLTAADTMDDVLIKAGATNFLQVTNLHRYRPDQTIRLTNPGRYEFLLENIAVHKYFKELECCCELTYQDAVISWYDNVYQPLVHAIRERGILKFFPKRTEADLYVWLITHRAALETRYGVGQIDTDELVEDLEDKAKATPIQKLEQAIKGKLDPDGLPSLNE